MPILLSEGKIKSFDFENTKLNVLSQAELAVMKENSLRMADDISIKEVMSDLPLITCCFLVVYLLLTCF